MILKFDLTIENSIGPQTSKSVFWAFADDGSLNLFCDSAELANH
jgi:hypothetical protein